MMVSSVITHVTFDNGFRWYVKTNCSAPDRRIHNVELGRKQIRTQSCEATQYFGNLYRV